MTTFWFCSAIAAAALLAAEVVLRLERRRIVAEIQRLGGHVLEITWRGFERARFQTQRGRAYDVIFDDRSGRRHRARLLLALFAKPIWLEDAAAGRYRSAVAEGNHTASGVTRPTVRLRTRATSGSRAA